MAASTELSTQNVVKALQALSVEKTTELVFHLGVDLNVLDDIEIQYNVFQRKIHSIQAWLDNDTDASWEKLVSSLKQIKMGVVAASVESTFLTKAEIPVIVSSSTTPGPGLMTVPPVNVLVQSEAAHVAPVLAPAVVDSVEPSHSAIIPTQSSAVSVESVAEVKATIEQLEDTFTDLMSETRSSLSNQETQDPKFLDRFRDHLLVLPIAKKAIHAKFFYRSEDDILEAKNIRKIFAILSRYCNYTNVEIILHLVKKFCEVTLRIRMLDYCKSLEAFEIATTIDIYLCAISARHDVLEAFSKMVMKINKPASLCTLHEIRQLKEALAEKASLHSYSMYIESVAESSVLVVLRFPPICAEWILTSTTPDFLHAHRLTELCIDGKHLTIHQGDIEELNHQLLVASKTGNVEEVISLLFSGADMNTANKDGESALMGATWEGKTEVVRELVKAGVNLDLQDKDGNSALMGIATGGKTEIFLELLKAGANLNLQDRLGYSALMYAALFGKTKFVVELVKAGANLNLQNEYGATALMEATFWGRTEVVVELVKAGANLNLQNTDGDSSVIRATVNHERGTLRELVSAGADLNLQNKEGLTALMMSARNENMMLTDILLTGDNIDKDIQENNTGWSALFFAAEEGDVATTESLLRAGANAHLKDKDGLTALDVASVSNKGDADQVYELLSRHMQESATAHSHHGDVASDKPTLPADRDKPSTDLDRPATDQGISATDQGTEQDTTPTLLVSRPRQVTQTLRNLVNRSSQRLTQLFNQLNRRLKSLDEKEQFEASNERSGGVEQKGRDQTRPPDIEISNTDPVINVIY